MRDDEILAAMEARIQECGAGPAPAAHGFVPRITRRTALLAATVPVTDFSTALGPLQKREFR